MVILEGPDCSGKTTLSHLIQEAFPELQIEKSRGAESDYDFWIETLRQSPEILATQLWDRFFFGELTYGPVLRGRIRLTRHQLEVVESLILAASPLIIKCQVIENPRLFHKKPQLPSWHDNLQIALRYEKIFEKWNHLVYKPLETDLTSLFGLIEKYLATLPDWTEFRNACPYGRGQPTKPTVMVVGERFGPNNPLGIPMERSKTGKMVHLGLRKAEFKMSDVWITNAIKYGGALNTANICELASEFTLIQPTHTVALGRVAGEFIQVNFPDRPHFLIKHPGWFMRKHGSRAQEIFSTHMQKMLRGLNPRMETWL